jgi:hypothetical protein
MRVDAGREPGVHADTSNTPEGRRGHDLPLTPLASARGAAGRGGHGKAHGRRRLAPHPAPAGREVGAPCQACEALERNEAHESIGRGAGLTHCVPLRTPARCQALKSSEPLLGTTFAAGYAAGVSATPRLSARSRQACPEGRGATAGGQRASRDATTSTGGKGSEGRKPHERYRHETRPEGLGGSKPSRG